MNIAAFWAPVMPPYVLSGLGALAVALWAGSREVPLILSAVCAVSAVAWTLAYFRPTIHRFLDDGGGNTPSRTPPVEARRWTRLNWIRMALVAISWWGAHGACNTCVKHELHNNRMRQLSVSPDSAVSREWKLD
jgi:hypothetical protein